MRRFVPLVLLAALAPAAHTAAADPSAGAYIYRSHVIESFHDLGEPVEVFITAGMSEVYADTYEYGEPWTAGGCLEIFTPNAAGYVVDLACGEFGVHPTPGLVASHIVGELEGTAMQYRNDPEQGPVFEDLGPTTVAFDLTFTGTGEPRLAEPPNGIIFCDLPPNTGGGGALLGVPMARTATVSGSMTGTYGGAVDPATLTATLTEMVYAEAVACAE